GPASDDGRDDPAARTRDLVDEDDVPRFEDGQSHCGPDVQEQVAEQGCGDLLEPGRAAVDEVVAQLEHLDAEAVLVAVADDVATGGQLPEDPEGRRFRQRGELGQFGQAHGVPGVEEGVEQRERTADGDARLDVDGRFLRVSGTHGSLPFTYDNGHPQVSKSTTSP